MINKVNIICGRRGAGKTWLALQAIEHTSKKKSLICDTFDHPSYDKFDNIDVKQLHTFKTGVRHLFGSDTDMIFDQVAERVYNALVIYEDATKYIEEKVPEKVKRYVLDTKQKNVDLIFLFHALGDVPPKLFRWSDTLTLFKTADVIEQQKGRISCYDTILPVFNRVKLHPDPHYHETILIN